MSVVRRARNKAIALLAPPAGRYPICDMNLRAGASGHIITADNRKQHRTIFLVNEPPVFWREACADGSIERILYKGM